MNPADVAVDYLEAPARAIVRLRQMFAQHSLAERRITPRELAQAVPAFRRYRKRYELFELQPRHLRPSCGPEVELLESTQLTSA